MNLLITAAHCINGGGYKKDMVFIPGCHDGTAPISRSGVMAGEPAACDVNHELVRDARSVWPRLACA